MTYWFHFIFNIEFVCNFITKFLKISISILINFIIWEKATSVLKAFHLVKI